MDFSANDDYLIVDFNIWHTKQELPPWSLNIRKILISQTHQLWNEIMKNLKIK